MAEGHTFTFSDPDAYAAAFGDIRVGLTVTGPGDFKARLTRLNLQYLTMYWCCESLPRIAYLSLPADRAVLSFPVGSSSIVFGGSTLRSGDMFFHSCAERVHQRCDGGCQWGLISLSAEQFAGCSMALTGRPVFPPSAGKILRPARATRLIFQRLFKQSCHLAEIRHKLIERPEVARALEQEILHVTINCVTNDPAEENRKTRRQHAGVMIRFEETLSKYIDRKFSLPVLCAEIGVAERTLRMCCTEFLGVSPTRYVLLQRLNKARAALRRANPSTASVAEIARNNRFLELGRFAVTYRSAFGESPSVTLQRNRQG